MTDEPRKFDNPNEHPTFAITEVARLKIEEIANETGERYSVRLSVKGGGCSGLYQDMYYTELVGDLDNVYEVEGVQIIIDQFSHSYLGDFTLDFIDTPMNSGFKFLVDKQSRNSCGCGSSIGIV
jgi:iron-sulfur cluster assembly protein